MKTSKERIPIEQVNSEKDLGVIIDSTLKFFEHINLKIKIANKNLGIIFSLEKIFMNLFKSFVRPLLAYASSVWSPVYKKDRIAIENIQRRATKLVKSVSHLSYGERTS